VIIHASIEGYFNYNYYITMHDCRMIPELHALPPLPQLKKNEGSLSQHSVVPSGDVPPIRLNSFVFVPVAIEDISGYYCVQMHKVFCRNEVFSPTAFEIYCGKETTHKWRFSIRVIMNDGCKGKTLGQWLKDHGLEGFLPQRSSTGDISRSPSPSKEPSPRKKGTSPVKEIRLKRSPTKQKPKSYIDSQLMENLGKKSSAPSHLLVPTTTRSAALSPHMLKRNDQIVDLSNYRHQLPVVSSGTPVKLKPPESEPLPEIFQDFETRGFDHSMSNLPDPFSSEDEDILIQNICQRFDDYM